MKHQANCYRTFSGIRYTNFADLIFSDAENQKTIDEAKHKFSSVKKIKHPEGYHQLFVANVRRCNMCSHKFEPKSKKHFKCPRCGAHFTKPIK
jgi:predicted Zn-ribbon and HTH transcriptional regulator